MNENTDRQIWDALRKGDQSALRKIYDQEFTYLYNYGRKISSDQSLVEDSIQDLFIEIWNRRENLSSTDSIRKYLAISLKRKLIRQTKKSQKTSLKEDFSTYDFAAEISVETKMISDESKLEQLQLLKSGFSKLPARQQEVIYLKFYTGMDNESIAETMNITNQSVRNIAHKAIKTLSNNIFISILLLFMSTLFM